MGEGVFYSTKPISTFSRKLIPFLLNEARLSKKRRARICFHKSKDDIVHEMIILLLSDCYIRPHKHVGKVESYHILEGSAELLLFSDSGEVENIFKLDHDENVYLRVNDEKFHTLKVNSNYLLFHETTNGPLDSSKTIFADFSPVEGSNEAEYYMNGLRKV